MTAAEHISTAVAHLELADAIEQKVQPRRDDVLKPLNSARMFALRAVQAASVDTPGRPADSLPYHVVE